MGYPRRVDTCTPRHASDLPPTSLPDAARRVAELSARIAIEFARPALLLQALLHRSAVLEGEREGRPLTGIASNERLEFLGDAVVSLVVARFAYTRFADYDEGRLTAVRTALVRRSTMALLAESLGLGDYVYMGRAEARGDSRGRATVLAEAMEALVGAIYLDQGLASVERVLVPEMEARLDALLARSDDLNPKSRLQELAQARLREMPRYTVLSRRGPDHDARFQVEVSVGEHRAQGEGSSKQAAEQQAARSLLAVLEDALGSDGEDATALEGAP